MHECGNALMRECDKDESTNLISTVNDCFYVVSLGHFANPAVFKFLDIPGDNQINLTFQFVMYIFLQDFFPVLSCNRNF